MRVAEHALAHDAHVLGQLRIRVQTAARVVEIDVPAGVEAPVLGSAELVEQRRLAEGRTRPDEGGLRLILVGREVRLSPWRRLRAHRAQVGAYSVAVAPGRGISHAPLAQIS